MKLLHSILAAAVLLLSGCSTIQPMAPKVDPAQSAATFHGTLHVPQPGSVENQGRIDPWLVDDSGVWYDLRLAPGQDVLTDPASDGRGITIDGDLEVAEHVPIGASESSISVREYRFDEP